MAWLDGSGGFYPLPSLELGLSLERLLVVRQGQRPALPSAERAALKALDLLLEAGRAFALIVIDAHLRNGKVSSSQLGRLQLAAERANTALLFISETTRHARAATGCESSLGTFISLHLCVERESSGQLRVVIAKSKQGKTSLQTRVALDDPHSVHLDTTV